MTEVLFYLFGIFSVAGALGMLFNVRNTVAAAMCLVGTMVSLAVIYVLLGAYLIGVIQILVYAGAIVVLFLFVVMLLNLRQDTFVTTKRRFGKILGAICALASMGYLLTITPSGLGDPGVLTEGFGGYRVVGTALFTDYVLPFELMGMLLLAAMVGAVVLAKRNID